MYNLFFNITVVYENGLSSRKICFIFYFSRLDDTRQLSLSTYQQTLQHITTRIRMMIRAMNPINATTRRNQTASTTQKLNGKYSIQHINIFYIAYNTETKSKYSIQYINRLYIAYNRKSNSKFSSNT